MVKAKVQRCGLEVTETIEVIVKNEVNVKADPVEVERKVLVVRTKKVAVKKVAKTRRVEAKTRAERTKAGSLRNANRYVC